MHRTLRQACRRIRTAAALAALAWGSAAPAVLAQSPMYRLDETRRWEAAPPPPPPLSEAEDAARRSVDGARIAEARRLLAEDRPAEAKALLDEWIEANRRAGSPFMSEALLLRGDSLVAMDQEFNALYDYEDVAKNFRQSQEFPIAVERELEIAIRYANGLKLRVFGIRWGDPEEVLVELLIRVQERLPGSQAAERASIELADYYYRRRDLDLAYDSYDLYLQNFPQGPNVIHAKQRRILSDVGRFKGPRYNAAELINARVQVEEFAQRYPVEADATGINQALVARLDESTAAQLLDTADWYTRTGDEVSARFVLRRLLRDHPRTISSERAEALMRERGWWTEVQSVATPGATPGAAEEATSDEVEAPEAEATEPAGDPAQEGGER